MLPLDVHVTDFLTIGLLVVLEGLLSADNALVLAILVLGLPRSQQRRALRYGMLGAFGLRFLAVLAAGVLIRVAWVKLAGGLYLAYLAYSHFVGREEGEQRQVGVASRTELEVLEHERAAVGREGARIVFALASREQPFASN